MSGGLSGYDAAKKTAGAYGLLIELTYGINLANASAESKNRHWADFYRKGQLFRAHIYWLANRDRPVPDAKVAIYPFKRSFVVASVSTDVQSGQATMCYLPGMETPERECWYINMGAVDKSFFTTDALVRAAQ